MEQAIAVQENRPLTAAEIKAQVNLIQEVMAAVMKDGHHYGTVPGCGKKKILFKPGAEKLAMTFRLAVEPHAEEIPTDDGITFRVRCHITNQVTGTFLGCGVGECSTKEEKYQWRASVCDEEYEGTPEDRRREKWKKGYDNKKPYKVKQIKTSPADASNTVLKMAKKRALVDAVLTVTGASDIFDQDLEDMPPELRPNGSGTDKPPMKAPQKKKAAAPSGSKPEVQNPDDAPSEKQLKAIFAILTALGYDSNEIKHEAINEYLSDVLEVPVESAKELTKGQASTLIDILNTEQNKNA